MDSRHREKESVKDMECMFDDIKTEATQTKLTGSVKDKINAASALFCFLLFSRTLPAGA